jgi:hypothetical protein
LAGAAGADAAAAFGAPRPSVGLAAAVGGVEGREGVAGDAAGTFAGSVGTGTGGSEEAEERIPWPTPIPPTKVKAARNNATPVHALVGRVRFMVSRKLGEPNSLQSFTVGAREAGVKKLGSIGGGAIDGGGSRGSSVEVDAVDEGGLDSVDVDAGRLGSGDVGAGRLGSIDVDAGRLGSVDVDAGRLGSGATAMGSTAHGGRASSAGAGFVMGGTERGAWGRI